ncbi:MAG: site-2 protease family protein [Clostridia bacterium]|nr:hypothetical protein [Clostridium sp.]MBS6252600.1 hypothetical protein [Clostridium sp.]
MRFRIDLKIFIFLILFYLTNQIQIYALIMCFAIVHELGHLLTGIILGFKPNKIELTPFGLSIGFKVNLKDYNKKIKRANAIEEKRIIIAMAGPVVNLLIIFIIDKLNIDIYEKIMIIYSNLLLVLFNTLPILPLDGGRILKGILHIYLGKNKAEKYSCNISFGALIILTAISSIAILYFKNIAIFLGVIFLWILYLKEEKLYKNRNRLYELIKEEKEANIKYQETIENKIN